MMIRGSLIFSASLVVLMIGWGAEGASAQPATSAVDVNPILQLQADNNPAARRGQAIQVAANDGRLEELQDMNQSEQNSGWQNRASEMRAQALNELHRSEQRGLNVSAARNCITHGDQALQAGNYRAAERSYAYAREQMNKAAARHLHWGPLSSWSGTNP